MLPWSVLIWRHSIGQIIPLVTATAFQDFLAAGRICRSFSGQCGTLHVRSCTRAFRLINDAAFQALKSLQWSAYSGLQYDPGQPSCTPRCRPPISSTDSTPTSSNLAAASCWCFCVSCLSRQLLACSCARTLDVSRWRQPVPTIMRSSRGDRRDRFLSFEWAWLASAIGRLCQASTYRLRPCFPQASTSARSR